MLIAFPLTAAKIVGTDIFQAAILLAAAGAGHLVAGSVDLGATGWLLIGSIPGVLIGSQLHGAAARPLAADRARLELTLAGIKLRRSTGREHDHLIGGADRRRRCGRDVAFVRWLGSRGAAAGAPRPEP